MGKKTVNRILSYILGDPVWQSTRGHNPIEFFGSPFKVESNVQLECTYGQNRHDKNKEDSPEVILYFQFVSLPLFCNDSDILTLVHKICLAIQNFLIACIQIKFFQISWR